MNIIETNWKWSTSLSNRTSTQYIALHHAAAITCTAAQVDSWHKANGWSGIGYHFFVRKNGEIYRGRPLNKLGAHVSGMNYCSVGICAEGNYDAEKSMPAVQKNAIKELISYLKVIYPSASIVGHKEIEASDCPGKYYPLDEMKNNYQTNTDTIVKENNIEQLLYELKVMEIISDVDLWRNKAQEDCNIFYLLQNILYYAKTKSIGETADEDYEDIESILWDLNYRGVISNIELWREKANTDANVYWLLRKGLWYFRTL